MAAQVRKSIWDALMGSPPPQDDGGIRPIPPSQKNAPGSIPSLAFLGLPGNGAQTAGTGADGGIYGQLAANAGGAATAAPTPDYGQEGVRTPGVHPSDTPSPRPPVAAPNTVAVPNVAQNAAKQTAPVNLLQAAGSPVSALDGGAKGAASAGPGKSKVFEGVAQDLGLGDGLGMANFNETVTKGGTGASSQKGQASQATQAIPEQAFQEAMGRVNQGTPGMNKARGIQDALTTAFLPYLNDMGGLSGAQRTDLGPLMGLADSWFGGHQADSYKALAQRMAGLQGVGSALSGAAGKLSDSDQRMLESQLKDTLGLTSSVGATKTGEGTTQFGTKAMPELLLNFDQKTTDEAQKELDKQGGLGAIHEALQGISGVIGKHPGGDLPGWGINTPLGKVGGSIPNPVLFMQSEEGKDLKRWTTQITNELNHQQFGSRQTETEVRQTAAKLGTAVGAGPLQFKKALADYQGALQHDLAVRQGVMRAGSREKLNKAGAFTPDDFNFQFGVPPSSAGGGAPPAPDKAKLLEEAKRRAGGG